MASARIAVLQSRLDELYDNLRLENAKASVDTTKTASYERQMDYLTREMELYKATKGELLQQRWGCNNHG